MTSNKFPRNIRSVDIVKILLKEGFEQKRTGKGSHRNFSKKGVLSVVTVSSKKYIPMGTVFNILKQAEIPRDKFLRLLAEL